MSIQSQEQAEQVCSITPSTLPFLELDGLVLAAQPLRLYETETCHIVADDPNSGKHYDCSIDGVRTTCCDLVQAMKACKNQQCASNAMVKMLPDLQKAGFDMSKAGDMGYWKQFCPVLMSIQSQEQAEQVCS